MLDLGSLLLKIKVDGSEADSALNNIGSKLSSGLGNAAKVAATAVVGATTAVVGMGAAAVKTGMEFDSAMSEVKAIGQVGDEAFTQLRDKALDMAAGTKFTTTEVAEALKYMAMAGWESEEMLTGLPGVLNLAAAGNVELGKASDIVTDALTAFGYETNQAAHFADVMAQAASNSNTSVELMGTTFQYVGPLAGTMGYSIEDVATATGLMANAGIKGSKAGTSLRTAFVNLSAPTEKVAAALEELGLYTDGTNLAIYNSDGTMKTWGETMGSLREAFSGLDETQQLAYANTIFGKYAMSGMLAVINASEEDYNDLAEAIGKSDGAAQEMADTMLDNLAGSITLFTSALDVAKVHLSDELTPALKDFVDFGTKAIRTLDEAFQDGGLNGAMEALGTILSEGLNMIVQEIPHWVEAGIQLLGALGQGIMENMDTILDAAGQILTIMGEAIIQGLPSLLSAGIEIVGKIAEGALQAIPQILEVGADLIHKLAEGVRNNFPQMLATALETVTEFSGNLRENAGHLVDAGIDLILSLAQGIADGLPDLIENIPTIVSNIAGIINDNAPKILAAGVGIIATLIVGIVQAIPTLIANIPKIILAIVDVITAFNWINLGKTILTGIINGIKGMIGNVTTTFKTIIQNIQTVMADVPGYLKAIGEDIINGLVEGILAGFDWVKQHIIALGEMIVNAIKDFLGIHSPSTVFAEIGQNLIAGLLEGITKAWDSITKFFSDAIKNLTTFVTEGWNSLKEKTAETWNNIKEKTSEVWTNIKEKITEIVTNIKEKAVETWTNIKDKISELATGLKDKLTETWNNIKQKISETVDNIKTAVQEKWTAMKDKITELTSNIKEKVSEAWNNIKSKVSETVDSLKTAVSEKFSAMKEAITTKMGEVKQNIQDKWNQAVDILKNTNLRDVASNIINGFKEGLSSAWNSVTTWASNAVTSLKNSISNAVSWVSNKVSGKHRTGLNEVPYDGYVAELHRGERVLTAAEANKYDQFRRGAQQPANNTTTINFNGNYKFNSQDDIDYFMQEAGQLVRRKVS